MGVGPEGLVAPLVGAGGSGRRSLARLAAHIAEFELVTVEAAKGSGLAEWRDALRRLLLSAGLEDRQQALLLSDTQLVRDSFLEDISPGLRLGLRQGCVRIGPVSGGTQKVPPFSSQA